MDVSGTEYTVLHLDAAVLFPLALPPVPLTSPQFIEVEGSENRRRENIIIISTTTSFFIYVGNGIDHRVQLAHFLNGRTRVIRGRSGQRHTRTSTLAFANKRRMPYNELHRLIGHVLVVNIMLLSNPLLGSLGYE